MEQDLPIDIQTNKLVDWLISRRHVPREWPEAVRVVREKINNAIQDMPEHPDVTKLLSGTYINYYHCLQILEILSETEKDSKNILGWYTSQRMKDWKEVVHLYEKDNVYLGEASQMLVRNVAYEIPALKRHIAKCSQIQEECERKEMDCDKGALAADNKYMDVCKTIGIKGEKVKHELIDLLKDLPQEFNNIAELSKNLMNARTFYLDFITFTAPDMHTQCLPLLKCIMDSGNVTVYEWTYGEAPISVEEPVINYEVEDDVTDGNKDEGIDLGDENEIDFGDVDLDVDTPDVGDIDWGDLTAGGDDIDWGGDAALSDAPIVGITVEESGVAGGVARDNEALSILMYHKTREQFINELLELQGFLTQRKSELEYDGSVVSMSQFEGAPQTVQYQNQDIVSSMIGEVQKVLDLLTRTKMQHLYLISSSQKYVDRLASSLKAKKSVGNKLAKSKELLIQKRKEMGQEGRDLQPKLQLIISRTKELQVQIENTISKKYKNRIVNIMGGINTL